MKSHLVPKALTRPSTSGNFFIQGGIDSSPKRAWDSWYDMELVTEEGESILAQYDDWGVKELNRLKLTWTSWTPDTTFVNLVRTEPGMPSFGLRKVTCTDYSRLRLFFLSLLWRAAATKRPEFCGISLEEAEMNRLKRMVRDGDPNPVDFFPTTLLQIADRGPVHNLAPIVRDEEIDFGDGHKVRHSTIRFYLDGLIANMHRSIKTTKGIEPFVVGYSPEIIIQLQLLEDSFQLTNLGALVFEVSAHWPHTAARLTNHRDSRNQENP